MRAQVAYRPREVAVIYVGPFKLVLYLDPLGCGAFAAVWYLDSSGALLGCQPIGDA